ncbi:hypothetical protein D3C76_1433840 [compost metagenome]
MVGLPGVGILVNGPASGGLVYYSNAVGIGEAHRPDKVPAVLNPVSAGHLAVAIKCMETCPDRLGLGFITTRKNGGDTGLYLATVICCASDGFVSHPHARHVGNRVVGAGLALEIQAEFTSAWFCHCVPHHRFY